MMRILKDYWLILVLSALVLILLACQLDYLRSAASPTPTLTQVATKAVVPTLPYAPPTAPLPMPPVIVPPTAVPPPVIVTATDNVRVRAAPATSASVVDRLNKGSSAQAIGKTAGGDWLQIILPSNPSGRGWVSAEFVTSSIPLDALPVVQAVIPPAAVPPGVVPPPQPTSNPYYPPGVVTSPAPTPRPYYP